MESKTSTMLDYLFYMFHCASGNDGTKTKHNMAAYGLELILTQLLFVIAMVTFGAINIKFASFIVYLFVFLPLPIISYFLIDNYYIKSEKYIGILNKYGSTSTKKKLRLKIIVIFIFIISFLMLIAGGILMSYLLSLH